MKYIASLFTVFLLLGFNASAQDQKTAASSTAEITFESEIHDYGTIDYGADGTYAFKFTNTGKDPLVITNATGSCGCTVPKWPKEPILKGQSAFINVSYDTKRPGPFTKTVTVVSNAKTASKVLTIKGVVRSQEQTDDQMPLRKDGGMAPLENQSK
ncbi:MAG: DUF1573 domain-containing protein [Bacteroidia bacterium]|nr:DUF1573 domain-containing protein [Bacteroidia bacterium]